MFTYYDSMIILSHNLSEEARCRFLRRRFWLLLASVSSTERTKSGSRRRRGEPHVLSDLRDHPKEGVPPDPRRCIGRIRHAEPILRPMVRLPRTDASSTASVSSEVSPSRGGFRRDLDRPQRPEGPPGQGEAARLPEVVADQRGAE